MPNICENWVRLTGSSATIDAIANKAFTLESHFPAPQDLTDEEHYRWLHDQFSTKWIMDESGIGPAQVRRIQDSSPDRVHVGDGQQNTLTVFFTSAWFLPHGFYKLLVGRYPDLHIDYEYHCWESGFIGHGQMHSGDLSDPIHCRYDTLAELRQFVDSRIGGWQVDTGNPQLEYYEGDWSAFTSS